jgi:hypothetical protein
MQYFRVLNLVVHVVTLRPEKVNHNRARDINRERQEEVGLEEGG